MDYQVWHIRKLASKNGYDTNSIKSARDVSKMLMMQKPCIEGLVIVNPLKEFCGLILISELATTNTTNVFVCFHGLAYNQISKTKLFIIYINNRF